MLATPTSNSTQSMCLLHGDYHQMTPACWDAAIDWFFIHAALDTPTARDAYQLAVEQKMLNNLMKGLR